MCAHSDTDNWHEFIRRFQIRPDSMGMIKKKMHPNVSARFVILVPVVPLHDRIARIEQNNADSS